jgi:O-antigen/teichoic acid export membrane protein
MVIEARGTDSLSTADAGRQPAKKLPPVLGRLFTGTLWLTLRVPLQILFSLWQIPLIMQAIGPRLAGAYGFAWGFGFFQMLFEFGMSSALQRSVTERWTKGDRDGVDRAIACGMNFYAVMALVQGAALLSVAYIALPFSKFWGNTDSCDLIVKLLWLQVLTAPVYGLSAVLSSVLQAARRYDFVPRLELAVVTVRFAILWFGVREGFDFFHIVVAQTLTQIALAIAPTLWVMIHDLGHTPHFGGARREDFRALVQISFYMFLVQLSVVLADRVDTTVLGFAADDAEGANAVYLAVSKPFLMIRQTGWTLAYMVMPAVASLAAARDERGLDRVKYDGTRLHIALILPIALLAAVYAGPFLTLWVGDKLGYDAARIAPLLRLFLVATIPLMLSVPVQAAFGMNKVKAVALAALGGSIVNLPLSYFLTRRLGVSGVIWGTVLTTLFSNFLIPGVYVFRALKIDPRTFLRRTLSAPLAGAAALLLTAAVSTTLFPLHPSLLGGMSPLRWLPLALQLALCCLAYIAGYLASPAGRADYTELSGKFLQKVRGGRA